MKKLVMLGLIVTLFVACSEQPKTQTIKDSKTISYSKIITNYGNNVYYFAAVEDDFGRCLSDFLTDHPDLYVSGIASNNSSIDDKSGLIRNGNAHVIGYFVTFYVKRP